jgi:hypothetical protein
MKKTLTSKLVEAAQPRQDRRYEIRDTILPGFGLRISVTARSPGSLSVGSAIVKSATRSEHSRSSRWQTPARLAAKSSGRCSSAYEVRKEEPTAALTFERAVREFIEKYAKVKNRDWRRTESVLRTFSGLNDRALAEIKRGDVVRVLDGMIEDGIPIRANRALAAIKKLFACALDRGLIDVHPVLGLRAPAKEVKRDRILADAELKAFWAAAEALGYPFGPARRTRCAMPWISWKRSLKEDRARRGNCSKKPRRRAPASALSSAPKNTLA